MAGPAAWFIHQIYLFQESAALMSGAVKKSKQKCERSSEQQQKCLHYHLPTFNV